MTQQSIEYAKAISPVSETNVFASIGTTLSALNIWNPPYRKAMTAEQRAADDQDLNDFINEW